MSLPDGGDTSDIHGYTEALADFWSNDNFPSPTGRWVPEQHEEKEVGDEQKIPDVRCTHFGCMDYVVRAGSTFCEAHRHGEIHAALGKKTERCLHYGCENPAPGVFVYCPEHLGKHRGGREEVDELRRDRITPVTPVAADPWKHRSKMMECRTCMWFIGKKTTQPHSQHNPLGQEQLVLGRCRKRAPELGGFPVVFPADWCGDHKIDENKI